MPADNRNSRFANSLCSRRKCLLPMYLRCGPFRRQQTLHNPDYSSRQNSILFDMHLDSRATRSVWIDGVELPPTSALTSSVAVDVCIVGAGIAGLTTAYLLSREGVKVVVIDDGPLCGGETGRTTAHLANEIDDSYQKIESLHGRDGARLAAFARHVAEIEGREWRPRGNPADEILQRKTRHLDAIQVAIV